MFRVIRFLLLLAVLGVLALTGYALVGDLSPEQRAIEVPVTLTPQ